MAASRSASTSYCACVGYLRLRACERPTRSSTEPGPREPRGYPAGNVLCATVRSPVDQDHTLHRTTQHCTALHNTAPHYTRPHCTTLHPPHHTAPHHTAPHQTALHSTALYRTAPRVFQILSLVVGPVHRRVRIG
eukprot:124329-Pyramimonas_sp.AAC.1